MSRKGGGVEEKTSYPINGNSILEENYIVPTFLYQVCVSTRI